MPNNSSYEVYKPGKETFTTQTICGFKLEFKDLKTEKLWVKLHTKKCELCKKTL